MSAEQKAAVFDDEALAIVQGSFFELEPFTSRIPGARGTIPAIVRWVERSLTNRKELATKTFQIYTKLWKYQQTHRAILENPDYYGLKRHEIGEIASKIGQLYYHYYLRTSETNYLIESNTFYQAVQERQYFIDVSPQNQVLFVKKLRYYARFIVVCLLLGNGKVDELVEELKRLVDEYSQITHPDTLEWNTVLSEISLFVEAQKKSSVFNEHGLVHVFDTRFDETFDTTHATSQIQEAVLIGGKKGQKKFSELTIDVYRMLQTLERKPQHQTSPTPNQNEVSVEVKKRINPHKYLLYNPTLSNALVHVSTAFRDTNPENILLVYLSGDAFTQQDKKLEQGIRMSGLEVTDCMYPFDLLPYTRKNMMLIVDSNCPAFVDFSSRFDKNVLCLMGSSIISQEDAVVDVDGSLFTLFMTCPSKALLNLNATHQLPTESFEKWNVLVNDAEKQISGLLDPIAAISFCGGVGKLFLVRWLLWRAWCQVNEDKAIAMTNCKALDDVVPAIKEILNGLTIV